MKLVGLGESAQFLLTQFSTTLTSFEGFDVPKAQYVGAGEIPWDGESLVVSLGAISQGVPGRPVGTSSVSPSQVITHATLFVQLIREVKTVGIRGGKIGLPTKGVMDVEGVRALNDAGALYQAAINIKAAGLTVPLGVDFAIGQCVPIGPEGGLASVRIQLDVSIDGQ